MKIKLIALCVSGCFVAGIQYRASYPLVNGSAETKGFLSRAPLRSMLPRWA